MGIEVRYGPDPALLLQATAALTRAARGGDGGASELRQKVAARRAADQDREQFAAKQQLAQREQLIDLVKTRQEGELARSRMAGQQQQAALELAAEDLRQRRALGQQMELQQRELAVKERMGQAEHASRLAEIDRRADSEMEAKKLGGPFEYSPAQVQRRAQLTKSLASLDMAVKEGKLTPDQAAQQSTGWREEMRLMQPEQGKKPLPFSVVEEGGAQVQIGPDGSRSVLIPPDKNPKYLEARHKLEQEGKAADLMHKAQEQRQKIRLERQQAAMKMAQEGQRAFDAANVDESMTYDFAAKYKEYLALLNEGDEQGQLQQSAPAGQAPGPSSQQQLEAVLGRDRAAALQQSMQAPEVQQRAADTAESIGAPPGSPEEQEIAEEIAKEVAEAATNARPQRQGDEPFGPTERPGYLRPGEQETSGRSDVPFGPAEEMVGPMQRAMREFQSPQHGGAPTLPRAYFGRYPHVSAREQGKMTLKHPGPFGAGAGGRALEPATRAQLADEMRRHVMGTTNLVLSDKEWQAQGGEGSYREYAAMHARLKADPIWGILEPKAANEARKRFVDLARRLSQSANRTSKAALDVEMAELQREFPEVFYSKLWEAYIHGG